MKLSHLLEMYYSPEGVYQEQSFRACNRLNLFNDPSIVDHAQLKNQVKMPSWNHKVGPIWLIISFIELKTNLINIPRIALLLFLALTDLIWLLFFYNGYGSKKFWLYLDEYERFSFFLPFLFDFHVGFERCTDLLRSWNGGLTTDRP